MNPGPFDIPEVDVSEIRTQRIEAEKQKADAERERAETVRSRADRLAERLKSLGIDPEG